jgi:single-stranded DNA-binding protein
MNMDKWLPILLCFCVTAVSAEMYKWEDEDGNIHYTDQQPDQQAEELSLPPINSYTAPPIPPSAQQVSENVDVETEPVGAPPVTYEKLVITSPEMNETIRNSDGTVSVAYTLTPGGLMPGHQFQLMLDGRVKRDATTTLESVDRGSHTVKVQIVDANGIVQLSSQSVIFHLHREADGKETTDATKPDDNTDSYTPSDDADHSADENDGIVQHGDESDFDPGTKYDSSFDPGTKFDPENAGHSSSSSPSSTTFTPPAGTYTPNYNQKK